MLNITENNVTVYFENIENIFCTMTLFAQQ